MRLILITLSLIFTTATGYSGFTATRNPLRSVGQKSLVHKGSRKVDASIKMEDFGLLKGTGFGFDDLWEGNEVISEVGVEKDLAKNGLRYRMNRMTSEQTAPLFGLPTITLDLPIIGKTELGPPKVPNIWEAIGLTATSNNEARQMEKMKAVEKAKTNTKGVKNGPGAEIRAAWLEKYGYPRLVGSGGIFYADQLSTDMKPMGGFNMGKSGQMWPIPKVVKDGNYGGSAGWGMKKKGGGGTIDNLKNTKKI